MDNKDNKTKGLDYNGRYLDFLDYRGYHIDFYYDDPGHQVYAIFENEVISFGSYAGNWEEDMKWIIDEHFDVITRDFGEDYPGVCLKWFNNGGHQDVGLYYKRRLLYVWVTADRNLVDFAVLEKVKQEAADRLKQVFKYKDRLGLN